jgi:RimJ/RimL family protein N-acetyltransferase
VTYARTHDFELVRRVLTHPSQYRMASEDGTPAPEDWRPNEHELIFYVTAHDSVRSGLKPELLGVFTFVPQNAVCYEIHAALLPFAWGYATRPALRGAIAWMWANSPARRIVASIPEYNRLAIALSRAAGMKHYGTNPSSFQRGGALHDQHLTGISCPHS